MSLLDSQDHPQDPSPHSPRGQASPPSGSGFGSLTQGRRWDARLWGDLARRIGLEPERPLLLALSGGADSMFLLRVLAAAQPKPDLLVVHVDHGLRGEESRADAEFCRAQVRDLGFPFELVRVTLDRSGGSIEAAARAARYRALGRIAARGGRCVLTAHHADDALETLLWRWTRGSEGPGLRSLPARSPLPSSGSHPSPLEVARPLRHLRRAELSGWLRGRGYPWREDSSNLSPAHTRNRIRRGFLPLIERELGPAALAHLEAFGQATEALEERLAVHTADLAWEPVWGAEPAFDQGSPCGVGGTVPRARLARLPRPLARRALWRLFSEGTGRAPGRRLLERILDDLVCGRISRHTLPGGASVHLRSDVLVLQAEFDTEQKESGHRDRHPGEEVREVTLDRPCYLPDGRRLVLEAGVEGPLCTSPWDMDIERSRWPARVLLRRARPGDRFHALGAPGSKRLVRFLADRGVPRALRGRTWVLVEADRNRILGVVGHGPAEALRVRDLSRERLRLRLIGSHAQPAFEGCWERPSAPHRGEAGQAAEAAARRRLPGRRGRDTTSAP